MMNQGKRAAFILAVVLALGTTGAAMAAASHSHDGGGGGAVDVSLNNGQKWQTDDPLRRGMAAIRTVMADALDRAHPGQYSDDEYTAMARTVEDHVDEVVKNCRLPEDADAQLHIVLAEILDGVETMRLGPDRVGGVFRIVRALDAYGSHFDHPGFEPFQR